MMRTNVLSCSAVQETRECYVAWDRVPHPRDTPSRIANLFQNSSTAFRETASPSMMVFSRLNFRPSDEMLCSLRGIPSYHKERPELG